MLFRIPNILAATPTYQNITPNIQNKYNVLKYGQFDFPNAGNTYGWDGFGSGTNQWQAVSDQAQVKPVVNGTASCLEQTTPFFADDPTMQLNYELSFNGTLPAHTRLVVKGWTLSNNVSACGNTNTFLSMVIYDSDTDPTITNHAIDNPLSISSLAFTNNFGGSYDKMTKLAFEASAATGYNGTSDLVIDNVELKTTYFQDISSSTSGGSGDTVVIAASEAISFPQATVTRFSIQRTWDGGVNWATTTNVDHGNYYYDFFLWGVTYDKMQVSNMNTKRVYFTTQYCHLIDADTYVPQTSTIAFNYQYSPDNNYNINTHADARSIFAWKDPSSAATEEILVGHDGGMAKAVVNYANPLSSVNWVANYGKDCPASGECFKLNQIAVNLPFGIGSHIKNGTVALALQDNGVLRSEGGKGFNWTKVVFGDGWFVKFLKRAGSENRYLYNTNSNLVYSRPYNGGASNDSRDEIGGPIKYRPKATYAGEYTADVDIYTLDASYHFANLTDANTDWINYGVAPENKKRVIILAPDLHSNNRIAGYACLSFDQPQNGEFFISTDAGATWTSYPNPTNGNSVVRTFVSMYMDPKPYSGNTRLWARTLGYDGGSSTGQNRFYESKDGGASWTELSTGLPDGPVNVLEFDDRSRILYAGTDMGVYFLDVDAVTREWKCFSKNLPNCFVYDLDINPCTGKIYAAAFGRGAWESDLQPNPRWNDPNDTYSTEVIGNPSTHLTTWNSGRSKYKTIIVPAGEKLKIAGTSTTPITINMGYKTHIIVEPGGTLIVEHARLVNECGVMWGGIVVKGNPTSSQSLNTTTDFANQGYVKLLPGTVIENAVTGINASGVKYDVTGNNTNYTQYDPGHEGGIVRASGANASNRNVIFRNCGNAVNFFNYSMSNISSFDFCTFISNAYLQDERQIDYQDPSGPARRGTHTFVNNWACGDIHFHTCTFKTDLGSTTTFNPRNDLRGRAYMSYDAGAIFDNCSFENVNRGLMCGNGISFRRPVVRSCTFNNVWRAASFRGINDPEFTDNTVVAGAHCVFTQYDMNADETDEFSLMPFGVYYSAGTGYKIRYNDISQSGIAEYSFGIIMNNTWSGTSLSAHSLYRNTISNIDFGVDLHQDARGTQVKCNTLHTGQGIFVTPSATLTGLMDHQGSCLPLSDPGGLTSPAGNQFYQESIDGPPCTNASHIASVYGNPPDDFLYSQHNNDPYRAECNSGSTFPYAKVKTPKNCLQNCPDFEDCCPELSSDIDYDDVDLVMGNIEGLEAGIAELKGIIDGGDRQYLLETINDGTKTSSQVRTILISAGPYLSDEVLIAAINRSPALAYSDLKLILIDNSFLTHSVWTALANSGNGLVNDNGVIEAQENYSPRSSVEGSIIELYLQRNELLDGLAQRYVENEDFEAAADLYVSRQGYEKAVPLYVAADLMINAYEAADSIEDPRLKSLAGLFVDRADNGRMFDTLTGPDIAILGDIAEDPHSIAGERARMWLGMAKGISSIELMPLAFEGMSGRPVPQQEEKPIAIAAAKKQAIGIYPNPARNEINVEVPAGAWEEGTVITAYDMTGKRMVRLVPEPGTKMVTIPAQSWMPGVYIITAQRANGDRSTGKVVIEK